MSAAWTWEDFAVVGADRVPSHARELTATGSDALIAFAAGPELVLRLSKTDSPAVIHGTRVAPDGTSALWERPFTTADQREIDDRLDDDCAARGFHRDPAGSAGCWSTPMRPRSSVWPTAQAGPFSRRHPRSRVWSWPWRPTD